ncbi:variable surface protein [Plasmodium gonderi]|uniref:Variable surface protein n=1 Tax=Plasmodium gonderi TaxID=77519 RepID=A0A1Y1JWJ7_PLAGO|nr:variable surface protein [Plasmodium gonderi]GAW84224.1 variable surface protein [Plasmodium gonderi]
MNMISCLYNKMTHITVSVVRDNQTKQEECMDNNFKYSNEFSNKIPNFDKNTCTDLCKKCYELNIYILKIYYDLKECTDNYFYSFYGGKIEDLIKKCSNASKFNKDIVSYDENVNKLVLETSECYKRCKTEIEEEKEVKSQLLSHVESSKTIISEKKYAQEKHEEQLQDNVSDKEGIASENKQDLQVSGGSVQSEDDAYETTDKYTSSKSVYEVGLTQDISNIELDTQETSSSVQNIPERESLQDVILPKEGAQTSELRSNSNTVEDSHEDTGNVSDASVDTNTADVDNQNTDIGSSNTTPMDEVSSGVTYDAEYSSSRSICGEDTCSGINRSKSMSSNTGNDVYDFSEIGDSRKFCNDELSNEKLVTVVPYEAQSNKVQLCNDQQVQLTQDIIINKATESISNTEYGIILEEPKGNNGILYKKYTLMVLIPLAIILLLGLLVKVN